MNLTIATIQLNSGLDWEKNLNEIQDYSIYSKDLGANFIALPENSFQMGNTSYIELWKEENHPGIKAFSSLAKELQIWLHVGSITIEDDNKNVFNRTYVFNSEGNVVGVYDKMNLFRVNLDNGCMYNEFEFYKPGQHISCIESPWGLLGLTICFDIRFPSIYSQLYNRGCKIIFIPAAFTYVTGKAHWEVLVRARAIETRSFVIAPAQCGIDSQGCRTYGHSLIVSPWGEILSCANDKPGIILSTVNMSEVDRIRNMLPINL